MFLSTHDLELALQIADRIWLVEKGKDVVTGTPEDLSLNGAVDDFFSREGVAFDQETGLFRINSHTSRKIALVGEGCRYNMVKRALERIGIEGVEPGCLKSDAEYLAGMDNGTHPLAEEKTIVVRSEEFCFNGDSYPTVGELIAAVKNTMHNELNNPLKKDYPL